MKRAEFEQIGALVEKQTLCDPTKKPYDQIEYIDISSIDRINKKICQTTKLLGANAPSRAKKKLFCGDVLVSTVRPNLNAVALVDQDSSDLICSTGFCVLRPKKELLDSRYLFYQVQSPHFINYAVKLATGANYPAISDAVVYRYKIPRLSLDLQKKISTVLWKTELALKKRRDAIKLLDNFLKSTFLSMFGDPIRNPKGLPVLKISDFCETTSGGTPDRSRPEYFGGGIPWIKSGELKNSFVESTEETISQLGFENSSAKKLHTDSVLIAMYGATVGEVGLLKIEEATTNQAVGAIIPDTKKANPVYLFHLFQGLSKHLISRRVGGGQPNISQQIIRDLKVPLPPLEEQKKFSVVVERVSKLTQKMKSSETEHQNLFNCLMQKAFKGELF